MPSSGRAPTGKHASPGNLISSMCSSTCMTEIYACSKQHLDLVPLRHTSEWSLDLQHGIRLPTAHGEEIVRSMCFGVTVSDPMYLVTA